MFIYYYVYCGMARIKLFIATIALVFIGLNMQAQEVKDGLTWYTDINQVYKASAQSKKPVFAFFTGSDWCGWCKRLQATVFSKQEFKDWAKKNVILLELDFPRRTQLPEALAKQNEELRNFFQVQGYPTVWLFNMTKDAQNKYSIAGLGSTGYPRAEGGKEAQAFIESANAILKNKAGS
jgi:thioredoxin-related protein